MTSHAKGSFVAMGKRGRSKSYSDDDFENKRLKYGKQEFPSDIMVTNKSRIYNCGTRKKPAELFRKDLISAMKMADSEQLNREDYLMITDPWREEWEKGVQVPVNPDAIRKSCSVKIIPTEDPSTSSSSSGNTTPETPFKMPKKLLKFDSERDSASAKYEIDLTDYCWLNAIKESEEACLVSDELFEDIMNELEYHCARNMKAKHVGIEYDDHIICAVCRSPDAEDGNEMVFCDSCNICVHQACYGITSIPDGEWVCRLCKEFGSQSQKTVQCVLCPNMGGALKPTSSGKWAHVACALWVPEVSIGCVTTMEPITKIKQIPASRWNLMCSICNVKQGTPIQCSIKTCKAAYHVTCAFNSKLKMKAIVENNSKGVKLKSYCPKHSDKTFDSSEKNCEVVASNHSEIEIATTSVHTDSDKNNRFWMYIDINEINQLFVPKLQETYSDLSLQTVQVLVDTIQQYWKVKRTSNFGLPLIKVVSSDTIEELQKERRNDIIRLRVNLERIRNLSYMIIRREKIKRSWLQTHREITERSLSMLAGYRPPEIDVQVSSVGMISKSVLEQRDREDMIKDIVNSNVIYDDTSTETMVSKKLCRELNRIAKVEKIKSFKPNPYAKYYVGGPKRKNDGQDDEELQQTSSLVNGETMSPPKKLNGIHASNHHNSQSMPLKTKSVPTNVQKTEVKVRQSPFGLESPGKVRLSGGNSDLTETTTRSGVPATYKIPRRNLSKALEAEEIACQGVGDGPRTTRKSQLVVNSSPPSPVFSPQKSEDARERRLLRSVMQRSQHNCTMEDVVMRATASKDVDMRQTDFNLRQSLIH